MPPIPTLSSRRKTLIKPSRNLKTSWMRKFGTLTTLTTTVNNFMDQSLKISMATITHYTTNLRALFRMIAQEFQQSTLYHHMKPKYISSNLPILIKLIKLIPHQSTILLLQETKLLSYKSTTYIINR